MNVRPRTAGEVYGRVQDRALLAFAGWLMPTYLTRGHVEKPKRPIDRQRNRIQLDAYLSVLSDISGRNAHNEEMDLIEAGLARGMLRREATRPVEPALGPGELALHYVSADGPYAAAATGKEG